MPAKLTPEEFEAAVREIIKKFAVDNEACHGRTDDLMEDVLISLGYGAGVELIRRTERWYA
jgi:hypothetical protein